MKPSEQNTNEPRPCYTVIEPPKLSDWQPERGLCMAFLLALIMAVLVVWASYGSEIDDIKRSVDERGTYKYYHSDVLSAKPAHGEFEGNCTVYAATYKYELEKAGYSATLWGYYHSSGESHAVTIVFDHDGKEYVLDNFANRVIPTKEYIAMVDMK